MTLAESIYQTHQQNRLNWYEEQIRKQTRSLAAIFIELRKDGLQPWKAGGHESYEDYCREVWGMSPRRLQQIAAGESVKALLSLEAPDLAPVIKKMPEGQVRELVATPPENRLAVLRETISRVGKMTARKIKQAKARVIEPEAPAPAAPLEPAVDKCPGGNGTDAPMIVPGLTDDYCLELSAWVTGNVEQRTGRAVTESEDADLAMRIADWLRSMGL